MTYIEDILDELGISYRQLDYWCRQGYIAALDRDKETSGVRRKFDQKELAVAARMARLIDRGLTPKAAARIARATPGVVHLGHDIYLTMFDPPIAKEAS